MAKSKRALLLSLVTVPVLTVSTPAAAQEATSPSAPTAPASTSSPVAPPMQTTPPPGPPATPPMGPQPFAGMRAPRVQVNVDAMGKNAVVERLVTTDETYSRALIVLPMHSVSKTWEQVCVAPCVTALDPFASYRIARQNHVSDTSAFTLPQGKEHIDLQIDPGNLLWHRVGARATEVGVAAAVVGGALLTLAPRFHDEDNEKAARVGGGITLGAGVLALAIGIPLLVATQTHVSVDGQKVARTRPRFTAGGLVF